MSAAHELVALDVDGEPVLTELVSAGAPAASARLLVVVLPGNPGAALFYATFVEAVAAAGAGAGARVVCVGHASHHALTASPRALSLAQQVAHKLAFLEAALAAAPPGRLRLALVGHSVGAWIALEAAASPRLPRGCVAAVAALFPTLVNIGASPRGRQLAPLFTAPGVFLVSSLAWLVRAALPRALLERAAAALVGGARAAATAAGLAHAHVATATLVLARHEMAEITDVRAATAAAARALGARLLCYFAPKDHWNSQGDSALVKALFPAACVEVDSDGHTHSFVLSERSVQAMAARTWTHIEAALGEQGDVVPWGSHGHERYGRASFWRMVCPPALDRIPAQGLLPVGAGCGPHQWWTSQCPAAPPLGGRRVQVDRSLLLQRYEHGNAGPLPPEPAGADGQFGLDV